MKGSILPPFPWFGGKSSVADLVWERFGDTPNYVEPFAGSLAVMLKRPAWDSEIGNWVDNMNRIETVNDADALLSNFWRATQADPDAVAQWADGPINEVDLHARHSWLMRQRDEHTARMMGDPDYYDAKVAGWWLWGICQWIGGGWCAGVGPWHSVDGKLVNVGRSGIYRQRPHLGNAGMGINRKLPHLGNAGMGIKRKLPHLSDAGMGINRQRPHLGNAGKGQCDEWSAHLRDIMRQLADRLRRVRVCCGDWSRVMGPSPTVENRLTAVFLDPPYSEEAGRDMRLYATDDGAVAHDVRRWAIANGDNPLLMIALCGYDAEHAMPDSWTAVPWKARGGYGSQGNGRANAAREVIWFSPHCLKPENGAPTLFDLAPLEADA